MQGQILSYDSMAGVGQISGDDGARYSFLYADLGGRTAAEGQRVDFVPAGSAATNIYPLGVAPAAPGAYAAAGAYPSVGSGIDWGKLFFSPEGRIRRSHFWAGWGIAFVAGFILGLIPLINIVAAFASIWVNICLQTKRLHDMGKTGWLQLIPIVTGVVAVIGTLVAFIPLATGNDPDRFDRDPGAALAILGPMAGLWLLYFVVAIGFLIWIGATEGEPGPNRFGPNPKGIGAADTFA